ARAATASPRRSASIGSTHPATGSHTSSGPPGASPNGSSTATGRPPSRRQSTLSSRSSSFVSVTSAAPGAASNARHSRSSVLPEPCGPYTPAVRSNGTHSSTPGGATDLPSRHPTARGSTPAITATTPPAQAPNGGGIESCPGPFDGVVPQRAAAAKVYFLPRASDDTRTPRGTTGVVPFWEVIAPGSGRWRSERLGGASQ